MAVRTFTMPKSLNESLASDQPPNSDADRSSLSGVDGTYSLSEREPLASHGPKRKPGITYAAQDQLPKLPIPELEDTCRRYQAVLKPLQNQREQEDTAAAVQDFLKCEGPELQARLKKYATGKTSYIEQFWYDSYLNFDNSVVLNLNPFFLLEDDPTPARNNQVTRAASLAISALCFVRAVRKEELPPDTLKGTPLCMYQYSRLFGTARIPTENGCQIAQDSGSRHIVILCKGQFYWFDVLDDNSDIIMTEKDMAVNLQVIVDDAEQTPIQEAAKGALGVLSTENRKTWAGLRDVLTRDEDSNNAECLSIVDSALFVLCLDYTEPRTGAELCGNMLCGTSEVVKGVQIGTCTNRWYDKMQIIVCKNGSAGINFEHTGVDGHTVLRMASDVYTDTILRFAKSINGQAPSLWTSTSPDPSKRDPESFGDVSTTPHKLEWDMLPELSTALRFAETRLADLIQQNEFEILEFAGYGKSFITSMGFSPDAFVQMAFQAAYYGLYGRVESTYEPAMTKVFLHGRTEAIRAATLESIEFVKTFWADNHAQQKIDALKKATQKHTALTKECAKALGQDRHLYALYCVWQRAVDEEGAEAASSNGYSSPNEGSASEIGVSSQREGSISSSPRRSPGKRQDGPRASNSPSPKRPFQQIPSLFADPAYDRLNTTILSTSNCGNPALRHFGFGPSCAEGFGMGYIIKDDSISVCISSKHRQTKRFVDSLEAYFAEIKRLLRSVKKGEGTGRSRVREIQGEKKPNKGKVIKADSQRDSRTIAADNVGESVEEEEEEEEEEDEGLGGYGFFDAGMLLQALKASQEEKERPSDKVVGNARRAIGKKLRLNDY
ncbi:MAG: hypothetical protein L6R41_004680 [Letrouitia leprolyta]|nr:MAG: hypothetical protein L6R41_004680 [Letrouitia leprolyta]